MKFLKMLELNPRFAMLKREEQIKYLQKAYEIVVDMIRLEIGLFPALMMNQKCHLDKLSFKARRSGIGSEIAFKEVRDLIGVNLLHEYDYREYEIPVSERGKFEIGYVGMENYGIPKDIFDNVNADHSMIPEIYNSKQMYRCTNYDDLCLPFFLMFAYQYPYPIIYRDCDTYNHFHGYDIKEMVELYDNDRLEVDDCLVIFMMCKACQLMYEDNGELGTAKHYDYMLTTFINMYNSNKDGFHNNRTNTIGMMSWHS